MARDIDFSKPLEEDDIHYLRQRSWLVDEAELQGFSIRDQVHNGISEPDEEEEVEDDDSDDGEEISYQDASVEELKAALKERKLPVGGSKPELIARLEEDDAKNEDEEEE